MTYKYTIDSYYDGQVDERLGTDTIYEWIFNDESLNYFAASSVYRYIQPEIAEAIYHEISKILTRLHGTDAIYFRLYVAVEMAKFGHIGPIESLDWEAVRKALSDKNTYTIKHRDAIIMVTRLIESRHELITKHRDCLPFGMNPSTAVYLHDLFAENGLVDIDLLKTVLRKQFMVEWKEDDQIDMLGL